MAVRLSIDHVMYIVFSVFSNITFGIAAITIAILFIFRKTRFLRQTFPFINSMILLGLIVNHLAVAFNGLELNETRVDPSQLTHFSHIICRIRAWSLSVGFTLVVGGLLVKILAAVSLRKTKSEHSHFCLMLGMLAFLLVADGAVLGTWEYLYPMKAHLSEIQCTSWYCSLFLDSPGNKTYIIEQCLFTDLDPLMIYAFIGWKSMVLLLALILSVCYAVQKQKSPKPVDSTVCVLGVSVSAPFIVIGLTGSILFSKIPTVRCGFSGGALILVSVVILWVVFGQTIKIALMTKKVAPQNMDELELEDTTSANNDLDTLRVRLASARQARSIPKLERSINQAKAAEKTELEGDISFTEDVLHGAYLLRTLLQAMQSNQVIRITEALRELRSGDWERIYPDEVRAAENMLLELRLVERLREAIESRLLDTLQEALDAVLRLETADQYSELIAQAQRLLARLKELENIRGEIQHLSAASYAELRSFQNPPAEVIDVVKAIYLLLGNREEQLGNWRSIQALLAKTGRLSLRRLTTSFDPRDVNVGLTDYVERMYLDRLDIRKIRGVSTVAEVFYKWCIVVIDEARTCAEEQEQGKIATNSGK